MKREEIRNMATYAAIQSIVENAVLSIEELSDVDRSQLTPYIFNGIVRRAKDKTTNKTTR